MHILSPKGFIEHQRFIPEMTTGPVQLPGFRNWVYKIHEVTPGYEQADLYRDSVLRFTTPVMSTQEATVDVLVGVAGQMEFDIQRKFSLRLYGFDAVRAGRSVLVDIANENVRRFLVQHAVSLKPIGVLDCGILQTDIANFLRILEEEKLQILAAESYMGTLEHTMIACGGKWRIGDMRTPTFSSFRENLASVRNWFLIQQENCERSFIYSFTIDSRDVLTEGEI